MLRREHHGRSTPAGYCLCPDSIRECPDTPFVLDPCGNGDPKAFNPKLGPGLKRSCTTDAWKRGIDAVAASRAEVMCKISGIVAFVPPGQWHAEDLAPVVNHCLDTFGPDRVFFGGDWPVCLLGSPVRGWVDALKQIISSRPTSEQRKLWSANAIKFYGLSV